MGFSGNDITAYSTTDPHPADQEARANDLYGIQMIECGENRCVRIKTQSGQQWATDFLSNSPFGLNTRSDVRRASAEAIDDFGALHSSVAMARTETAIVNEITHRLALMKTGDSQARIYPTTLSANIATAAGFASSAFDATAVVHPNAHATVQFAVKGAFAPGRIITSSNTLGVAGSFAKNTRRPVVIVEDGLYSMGNHADFQGLSDYLKNNANGWLWLDDAHSVGMQGENGRGKAMQSLASHEDRTVVTGSFGKAFGAAGGFMVGPRGFVDAMLRESVSDRFSCNLDVSAQGAILASMKILADPGEYRRLKEALAARLSLFDAMLAEAGIPTEQAGSTIAFRVVPCSDAASAIQIASTLLAQHSLITTPVYYPTIARGRGAIRVSLSATHRLADIRKLAQAFTTLLATNDPPGPACLQAQRLSQETPA